MASVYLDHNSTTPILPPVVDCMSEALRASYANPASQHRDGQRARRQLESTRAEILQALGANTGGTPPERLVLTSGGTEANNLAMFGLAGPPPGQILMSPVEHPSVLNTRALLESRGYEIRLIPVDTHGICNLDWIAENAGSATRLVSVMFGNHETGVIQPIREIASLCRAREIPVHCDAVQAVGKITVDFSCLGVDSMSLTAHKFHGPRGIGGLIVRSDRELAPSLYGGTQQLGSRPGTEDVVLPIGMAAALRLFSGQAENRREQLAQLRDRLEHLLLENIHNVVVVGSAVDRLPHTSNVAFPGVNRQSLLMALDMADVSVSTGSACTSGSSEPSHVLVAMGCSEDVIDSSIRFSVGATTTAAEIDEAGQRIVLAIKRLRRDL